MDIVFADNGKRFNYRVAAVCIENGRVLLHRGKGDSFWCLPGGRVQMLENSETALKRELREELEVAANIKRLLWVVEKFFTYDNHKFHEICFYYETSLEDCSIPKTGSFIREDGGREFEFQWVQIEELHLFHTQPAFLKTKLKHLPECVEHIVTT
ncbi:NUDIX hydrolase [Bacillus sp. BP-3]|uniref:NUDIX hydrolase n=1 Tax=Bacillus sp. BP-3 TaxID=3022773 RepID=UPI00232DF047|nr:NUDIX hydrolase [Bacillus sp. BP-3]MDC2864163.1 NUDIX hydrolase [Bacillus sp. BP-3]